MANAQAQIFINALNRANIFPAQYNIIHPHWRSSYFPGGIEFRRRRKVTCQILCRISVKQEALRLGFGNDYALIRYSTFMLWKTANKNEKQ
ncbi:10570_t:CDS:1, partial [Scutellospora calospora]